MKCTMYCRKSWSKEYHFDAGRSIPEPTFLRAMAALCEQEVRTYRTLYIWTHSFSVGVLLMHLGIIDVRVKMTRMPCASAANRDCVSVLCAVLHRNAVRQIAFSHIQLCQARMGSDGCIVHQTGELIRQEFGRVI